MENICAQQLDLTGLVSMRWFPKENASNVAALSNTRWCSTGLLSHELNMWSACQEEERWSVLNLEADVLTE